MNITPPRLPGMTDAEHARDTHLARRVIICLLAGIGLIALSVLSTLVGIWADPRIGDTGRVIAFTASLVSLAIGWISNQERDMISRRVRGRRGAERRD